MRAFSGAIFDVDGVLVDSPHEKAWREALRDLMETTWRDIRPYTTWSSGAFTRAVYEREVSGKPRLSGAQAALEHFGVPDDDRGSRVAEYAARKQARVEQFIEAGDFTAYPDGIRLVLDLKDAGLRLAIASSSKNATQLLHKTPIGDVRHTDRAGGPPRDTALGELFDAAVSGRDFARGKPDPEMFLTAARELGVTPNTAVVIEDAAAGIQAAKAGGMAAIGIARAGDDLLLMQAGADIVVDSLDSVDRIALSRGVLTGSESDAEP